MFVLVLVAIFNLGASNLDLVPVIVQGPEGVTLLPGDEMHLSCLVKAYPPPTAKIMKISPYEELNSLEEFTETSLEQDVSLLGNMVEEDSVIEVKVLQIVDSKDSGWYRCLAINDHGQDSRDCYVEVLDPYTSPQSWEQGSSEPRDHDMARDPPFFSETDELRTEIAPTLVSETAPSYPALVSETTRSPTLVSETESPPTQAAVTESQTPYYFKLW